MLHSVCVCKLLIATADGGRKFKGIAWLFMGPLDFAAHTHTYHLLKT